MIEEPRYAKESILSPLRKYYGEFSLGNLLFNANLQEFEQQVSYICNLVDNSKMTPEDACNEIEKLWQELKQSKKELFDRGNFPKA
ncbi:MAG: hypothetical protein AB4372_36820 [Xenococcus sp. (in: cyanobacteria)]